jgi:superfamily II DNA or RNA helicase
MSDQLSTQTFRQPQFAWRRWQLEALRRLDKLYRKGQRDFLLVATPSAGKTRLGLEAARSLLKSGEAERVVIVCHSDHLRKQWAKVAESFGINLDPHFSNANGMESSDYHGVVVTYQQVASASDLFRMNCGHRPTMVILDEAHHVGDRKPWATAIRNAFEVARFRLGMSGTLFREDGRKIPFVKYVDGVSRPDFTYGYAEGVADRVCRPIYFETFDGDLVWLRDGSEELHEHSMLDVVDRATAKERLMVALDPDREWLRHVLAKADEHLTMIREGRHRDAGGVVFARDQDHAKRIAKLVERITGEAPVLVISEDREASDKIAAFAEGTERWVIAVRMLSEGVDIPRLRAGVYATNVRTELFFRQIAGRLIRYTPGLREQSAVLFMPADETLIRYALSIKDEREHVIAPDNEDDEIELERTEMTGAEWGELLIKALSAEAKEHYAIFDGKSFVQPELKYAARVCREMGISMQFVQASALIRLGAILAGVHVQHEAPTRPCIASPQAKAGSYRIRSLRERVNAVTESLARQIEATADALHQEWVVEMRGMMPSEATEEDLELKLEWLNHRLADEIETRGYRIGGYNYSLETLKENLQQREK